MKIPMKAIYAISASALAGYAMSHIDPNSMGFIVEWFTHLLGIAGGMLLVSAFNSGKASK